MSLMSKIKTRLIPYGMIVLLLAGCGVLPPAAVRKPPASPAPLIKPEPTPPRPAETAPHSPPAMEPVPDVPPAITAPLPPPADTTVQPIPSPVVPAPRAPAVVALLDSAGRQEQGGQLESAAATLERALRVAPRNATVWYRLARVRLAQGQWQAAANLAAKSNSLAGTDPDLRRLNWTLIAKARDRLGDKAGARAARGQAAAQ